MTTPVTNTATFYQGSNGGGVAVQPMFTEAQVPGYAYTAFSPALSVNIELNVLVFGSAM